MSNTRPLRCSTLFLVAVLAAGTVAGAGRVTFAEVMRRAHEYVTIYEDYKLSTVMARERYHQQVLDRDGNIKAERTLLSDYLLVQLPDEDWVALRDVYEVDGATVADRGARLKTLFAGPREQFSERVLKMAKASAEFNLGDLYYRTLNLPTFALRILRPASRKRMTFDKAGEEQVDSTSAWIVGFRETKGPTFSGTPDGVDLPAHGRFWVDPHTGAVLRSEMIVGGTRRVSARATITVSYAPEPSLAFRVPVEMRERYDNPRRKRDDVVVALATYSDFRPFDWRLLVRLPAGSGLDRDQASSRSQPVLPLPLEICLLVDHERDGDGNRHVAMLTSLRMRRPPALANGPRSMRAHDRRCGQGPVDRPRHRCMHDVGRADQYTDLHPASGAARASAIRADIVPTAEARRAARISGTTARGNSAVKLLLHVGSGQFPCRRVFGSRCGDR